MKLAKDDVLVMHPGPINRGVEMSPDVADGDRSVIMEQVTNGVAVRMALLYLLLEGDEGASEFQFVSEIRGGSIPTEYVPAVEKGFRECLVKGRLIGVPVQGIRIVINDGQSHSVDSSEMAFSAAARGAFRQFYPRAKPQILEPIMKLEVEGPGEFQGAILKTIMQRRGQVIGSTEEDGFSRVEAEVPLSEMFGYATDLRSMTQGKAEFTMEFAKYLPAPAEVQKELKEKYKSKIPDDED